MVGSNLAWRRDATVKDWVWNLMFSNDVVYIEEGDGEVGWDGMGIKVILNSTKTWLSTAITPLAGPQNLHTYWQTHTCGEGLFCTHIHTGE